MRVLFDTNVILDLLLEREPFADAAAALLARAELGAVTGFVGATTVTTIHYLATKVIGREAARDAISSLMSILHVAAVSGPVLDAALQSPLEDFEDAVLLEAGRAAGADAVVTRDLRDFAAADIPIHHPTELLAILAEGGGDAR